MNSIVIIPARGGSKGVPNKNIKILNDKPLISYSIDAARQIFEVESIFISTDSLEIKKVVEKSGLTVPFIRPAYLASDTASTQDVLLNVLEYYESEGVILDTVVLLQPTSPFRTEKHIKEALKLYHDKLDMVVSVKETKANPYFNLFEESESGFLIKSKNDKVYTRRQDCPKVWEYNGAIYIINVASLKQKKMSLFEKVLKYEMDDESSHDIDTMMDWFIAEQIVKSRNSEE